MTLNLLLEEKDGKYVRTKQSIEIAAKYDEIIIDEYQDTNMVQDMIFTSVSNNEDNLFTVGDVKQSIYRFREAMPEIFLNRQRKITAKKIDKIQIARIIRQFFFLVISEVVRVLSAV